jgi:hypothetical protein
LHDLSVSTVACSQSAHQVALDLDEQLSVAEPDAIARRRAVHASVGLARDCRRRDGALASDRFRRQRDVRKAGGRGCRYGALSVCHRVVVAELPEEAIAAPYASRAANVDERDRLALARLEADGGAGGDVQAAEEGEVAIEGQMAIRLGEVVVRPDLDGPVAEIGDGQADARPTRAAVELDGRAGRAAADAHLAGQDEWLDGRQRGKGGGIGQRQQGAM